MSRLIFFATFNIHLSKILKNFCITTVNTVYIKHLKHKLKKSIINWFFDTKDWSNSSQLELQNLLNNYFFGLAELAHQL